MTLLLLGLLASVVIHEAAHLFTAKQLGWEVTGFGISRTAFGVRAKTSDPVVLKSLWMVAIVGPLANVAFGDVLYTFHTPTAIALAYANYLMAFINLLPIPGSDGTHILNGLREELE